MQSIYKLMLANGNQQIVEALREIADEIEARSVWCKSISMQSLELDGARVTFELYPTSKPSIAPERKD